MLVRPSPSDETSRPSLPSLRFFTRAGDRTRTGDVQLGKLAFYQLNYARSSNAACAASGRTKPSIADLPEKEAETTMARRQCDGPLRLICRSHARAKRQASHLC